MGILLNSQYYSDYYYYYYDYYYYSTKIIVLLLLSICELLHMLPLERTRKTEEETKTGVKEANNTQGFFWRLMAEGRM